MSKLRDHVAKILELDAAIKKAKKKVVVFKIELRIPLLPKRVPTGKVLLRFLHKAIADYSYKQDSIGGTPRLPKGTLFKVTKSKKPAGVTKNKDVAVIAEAVAKVATATATAVPATPAPAKKLAVVCQDWLESEAGWGQRPDGVSIHLSIADRKAYCKEYWAQMPPRDAQGSPPSEYSRESGTAYLVDIDEGGDLHRKLLAMKDHHGIRIWDRAVEAQLRRTT